MIERQKLGGEQERTVHSWIVDAVGCSRLFLAS